MPLIKVAETDEMQDGEARVVNANGAVLALYRVNGQYFVTTNTCAHQGGPLGEGELDGRIIMCPWHGWKFNVETGRSTMFPNVKVKTYSVRIDGKNVMVEI